MAAPESVVLEEEIDQNYEPTQDEIVEYATWLGMVSGGVGGLSGID
jgi:centrosomal protein CEP164